MTNLTADERRRWCAHDDSVADLVGRMQTKFPALQVVFKDDSRIYQLLSRIIPPRVLYRMTTTLFSMIAISSRARATRDQDWYFRVLGHEFVHLYQFRRAAALVGTYLAPQIFLLILCAAAASLAWQFLALAWLQWLITVVGALVTFAPWPSPGRLRAEISAYTMNAAIRYWRSGQIDYRKARARVDVMCGWRYWFMAWSKRATWRRYCAYLRMLTDAPDQLRMLSPAFEDVFDVLQRQSLNRSREHDQLSGVYNDV